MPAHSPIDRSGNQATVDPVRGLEKFFPCLYRPVFYQHRQLLDEGRLPYAHALY